MAENYSKKEVSVKRKKRIASFFAEFTINKKTRRNLLLLAGIGVLFILAASLFQRINIVRGIFLPLGVILTVGPPGILFVLSEKRMTRNILIHLTVLFIGMFFKRMHWPGASATISVALLSMAIGYLFFAVKNLYAIKNNNYFRFIGSITAFFIFLMSLGMVFKYLHWPGAGLLVTISLLPSIIFTMIVLITLPGSGYMLWEKRLKLIFTRKLLIPWMFFLLFAAASLLLPKDISKKIFSQDSDASEPFWMRPYEIEQMDGLEPGQ